MKALAVFAEDDNKPLLITTGFHQLHEVVMHHLMDKYQISLLKPIFLPNMSIFQSTDLLQKWIVRDIIVQTFIPDRAMKHEERIYCYYDADYKLRFLDYQSLPDNAATDGNLIGFVCLNIWRKD